jgi:hypothetical protein
VTFKEGRTILATVPLSDGEAVFNASNLSMGKHTITVSYSGDGNFSSSSGSIVQVVNRASGSARTAASLLGSSPTEERAKLGSRTAAKVLDDSDLGRLSDAALTALLSDPMGILHIAPGPFDTYWSSES